MKYKKAYEEWQTKYVELLDKYNELKGNYDVVRKESRSLVNYILRIKKKCDTNNLWLMASHDPYKPLTAEEQQGPMITKLFKFVFELKRKMK